MSPHNRTGTECERTELRTTRQVHQVESPRPRPATPRRAAFRRVRCTAWSASKTFLQVGGTRAIHTYKEAAAPMAASETVVQKQAETSGHHIQRGSLGQAQLPGLPLVSALQILRQENCYEVQARSQHSSPTPRKRRRNEVIIRSGKMNRVYTLDSVSSITVRDGHSHI